MKNILAVLMLIGSSFTSFAGEIKVTWQDPKSYIDVKGAEVSDARFQKRVFKSFEKHFDKLAQELPENASLNLVFTNINLAGDVRYNFSMSREIRLVSDLYWPMLQFEYQLAVGDDVVDSGTAKLKDMAFMARGSMRYGSDSFKYEKRLFDEWFADAVTEKLDSLTRQHNAVMASE